MLERSTDGLVSLADDRFELSRGHVAALGLGTFFFGVLAFLVGLQLGRTGTAEAPQALAAPAGFTPAIDDITELDQLLREVELARSALPPQVATDELPLRFPSALTAGPEPTVPSAESQPDGETTAAAPGDEGPARPANPPALPGSGWSVQVATTPTLSEAEMLVERLQEDWPEAHAVAVLIDGRSYYRVRVGGFPDQGSAQAELSRLVDAMPTADPRLALAP